MTLLPTTLGADDELDMVVIRLGDLRPRIPYQAALELAQSLRVGCKAAARYDRQSADFVNDMAEDINDTPRPHRGFRRSRLVPNVNTWAIEPRPPLVAVLFDGAGMEMGYEEGVRLHFCIRRAARRAKAWAGDTGKGMRMLANLTDAEGDYRLGLG